MMACSCRSNMPKNTGKFSSPAAGSGRVLKYFPGQRLRHRRRRIARPHRRTGAGRSTPNCAHLDGRCHPRQPSGQFLRHGPLLWRDRAFPRRARGHSPRNAPPSEKRRHRHHHGALIEPGAAIARMREGRRGICITNGRRRKSFSSTGCCLRNLNPPSRRRDFTSSRACPSATWMACITKKLAEIGYANTQFYPSPECVALNEQYTQTPILSQSHARDRGDQVTHMGRARHAAQQCVSQIASTARHN